MNALANAPLDVPVLLAKLGAYPRRITSDSRRVEPGVAFAAYRGTQADGRAYVADAIARGAAAVLWDADGFNWNEGWQVKNASVLGLQARLGAIADFIYGSPSQRLWIVGVTGTNGKTSCAHWIAQALDTCGRRAAVLGTLGNGLVGHLGPAAYTTPDAAVLHELLAQFNAAGASAAVIEVSSHGLAQGRLNGAKFDVALFTNLSRDHLDYHGTMAAYGQAKAKLFTWPGLRTAVINADDSFGQSLIDAARSRRQHVVSYGFANAGVAASGLALSEGGVSFAVATPWGNGRLEAPVAGAFNASNLLGALAVLLASDVPFDAALAALAQVQAPAGRMQRFGGDGKPLVVVDYAHTPDALEQALRALRPAVAAGRELVCVFGCGGDRDPGKRAEMGNVAAKLANRVVVTSDNPRFEDPGAIANAIAHAVREQGNRRWVIELDRRQAIAQAIADAAPGDVVLVAGKGHETYQECAGVRLPFSDAREVAGAIKAWSSR
ncbi:MAG: UDP-N-acetylmuramoyl-L-alanyl-D-glutamate--2,6-diaminopimelate ligase [Casimicrobiaceae bacterium]